MTRLEEPVDLLHRGTEKIGIPLNSVQIEQFTQFLNILSLFNDTYKLVAASESEIVIKHILDSLAAAPILSTRIASRQWKNPRICDVGSGAGFPGIPLAIVMSDCRFTFRLDAVAFYAMPVLFVTFQTESRFLRWTFMTLETRLM